MNRTKGILAAGTLTGLVLITILALGFGNLRALTVEDTAVPATAAEVLLPETTGMTTEEALQAWQDYSAELEQTVRTMQDRESTYQTQLDAANQTIIQLQDSINSANSAPAYYDDDEYEHEAHEREEYEHEYEYGEHDD